MPRVSAVYADNPVLTAAQRKRMVKATPKGLKLRLSYAVLNVFQRYWYGQNDPLYAVLSRRGNSVQFVDVVATEDEVGRLQSVAEEIIEAPDTTGAEKRTAQSLLRQIPEDNPMKGKMKGKKSEARCGCGRTDAGQTMCGCVVPNPVSRAYWTAAPKSYDYGYTVDTGRKAKSVTGATWRLVTTTDEVRFQSHQVPRYQSGLKGIVVAGSSDAKKLGLPDVKNNPTKDVLHFTTRQKTRGGKKVTDYYVLHHQDWIRVNARFAKASLKSGEATKVPWSHGKLPHHADGELVADDTLGLMMHNWHAGQNDPIYGVGSVLFAGRRPSVQQMSRAMHAIDVLRDKDIWTASDRRELTLILKNLQHRVGHAKSKAAASTNPCGAKDNPVATHRMTRPQIEKLVWGKTPRDYRGMVKGKKAILVWTKQGTSLVHLDRIGMDQLRQLAGIKDNPTCKYQDNPTKIAIRSITVEAPWMRRTVRGSKKVWANADSAARAVCKSKPSTAAKNAKMVVTYRYTNGEQVQWKLATKCSREKLSTRVKKTLIPAAGFDWPSRGRRPTGPARQSMLDLLAYYDTGPAIRAPWDK